MKPDNNSNTTFIDETLFNDLFPFHMVIDDRYLIISAGISLLKVMPNIIDKDIRNLFEVIRPSHIELSVKSLLSDHKNLEFFILKDKFSELQMRSVFKKTAIDNNYAILGIPWVNSIEQLYDLRLDLSDFSTHDSMTDMLMAIQLQRQSVTDLQEIREILEKRQKELKETVRLLDTSKKSLQTLIDSSGLGILITDLDGHIDIFNERVQTLLHIHIDDKNSAKLHDLVDIENVYDSDTKLHGDIYETELRLSNGQDSEDVIRLTITPITNIDDVVTNYCHVFRDVTDEIKFEAMLRENEKSRAVSVMTGQIAHQINNLLGGILANVDSGKDAISAYSNEPILKPALENIDKLSSDISKITNSMLAFSGQQYLSIKTFDVNEQINNTISKTHDLDSGKSIISLSLDNQPLFIKGDRAAFSQCILNIIDNSMASLGDRKNASIKISTYIDSGQELSKKQAQAGAENYICVSVKDNGNGIDEVDKGLIFDPFFTTTPQENQGMGLSYVQGYIKQIDGHIRVKTSCSVGTTIYLYFPLPA